MKAINPSDLKTIVQIQSNIPKLAYGSGAQVGGGFLDQYFPVKQVRGRFKAIRGRRTLDSGTTVSVQQFELLIRYDVEISNHITKQMRFTINGHVYTLDSWDVQDQDRPIYFVFILNLYGK